MCLYKDKDPFIGGAGILVEEQSVGPVTLSWEQRFDGWFGIFDVYLYLLWDILRLPSSHRAPTAQKSQ